MAKLRWPGLPLGSKWEGGGGERVGRLGGAVGGERALALTNAGPDHASPSSPALLHDGLRDAHLMVLPLPELGVQNTRRSASFSATLPEATRM